MAGIVENNVVHMEWQQSGWLETSTRKGKKPAVFIFASQTYPSTVHGEVTVFFTAHTAFVIESDEGLWSAEEFIPVVKGNMGGNFPYDLDEYVSIIDSGGTSCKQAVLEKYGIVDAKEDIEARLNDVSPYGIETDYNL